MIYLALILTRNLESQETPTFHGIECCPSASAPVLSALERMRNSRTRKQSRYCEDDAYR